MFLVNVYGIKFLPILELIGGVCHLAFFVALAVPLIVLAPRSSASFVFTDLIDDSGWNNGGISWCVGLLTVTYCFTGKSIRPSGQKYRGILMIETGIDGAVHMSEEVRNSATTVPKILIATILINGAMAFGFLLVLLFCVGNVTNAISTPTGYPIIEVFYQATGSTAAATAMMCAILVIAFASTFGILASVSRLTWAFARDGGLPFSDFFAHVNVTPCAKSVQSLTYVFQVNPHYRIPIRSIGLVTFVVVLLSFINLGSSTALNAILSLSTLALYVSYMIPIILKIIKTFRGQKIVYGPFNLGRFSLPINIFTVVYLVFISIFLPFPPEIPVTAENMNYGGPVLVGVIIFALLMWFVGGGKRRFVGPRREIAAHELQTQKSAVHVL